MLQLSCKSSAWFSKTEECYFTNVHPWKRLRNIYENSKEKNEMKKIKTRKYFFKFLTIKNWFKKRKKNFQWLNLSQSSLKWFCGINELWKRFEFTTTFFGKKTGGLSLDDQQLTDQNSNSDDYANKFIHWTRFNNLEQLINSKILTRRRWRLYRITNVLNSIWRVMFWYICWMYCQFFLSVVASTLEFDLVVMYQEEEMRILWDTFQSVFRLLSVRCSLLSLRNCCSYFCQCYRNFPIRLPFVLQSITKKERDWFQNSPSNKCSGTVCHFLFFLSHFVCVEVMKLCRWGTKNTWTTWGGKLATLATWIPKLWSVGPGFTSYKRTRPFFSSACASTCKFFTVGISSSNWVNSWKWVAKRHNAWIFFAMCLLESQMQ